MAASRAHWLPAVPHATHSHAPIMRGKSTVSRVTLAAGYRVMEQHCIFVQKRPKH
jgi:hypothetical protein